jgi:hypothetical protein
VISTLTDENHVGFSVNESNGHVEPISEDKVRSTEASNYDVKGSLDIFLCHIDVLAIAIANLSGVAHVRQLPHCRHRRTTYHLVDIGVQILVKAISWRAKEEEVPTHWVKIFMRPQATEQKRLPVATCIGAQLFRRGGVEPQDLVNNLVHEGFRSTRYTLEVGLTKKILPKESSMYSGFDIID